MSAPTIPPRPTRASGTGPTAVKDSMPQVPPRPSRKIDPSPVREEHTRSPFNEPFGPPSSNRRRSGSHLATQEVPARPPSVTLPSVGQEGLEYDSYDQLPPEAHGVSVNGSNTSPEQTVNVSANTPLHQPKASVPQSTAKSRISTVTRTDSNQAAAAGIGKAKPDDDVHVTPADSTTSLGRVPSSDGDLRRVRSIEPHPLRQQASNNRSTSSLRQSRPGSVHEFGEHEEGIPEIGMQIPLHPNAGDVQAPSPAPGLPQHTPGVGFFNDGSQRAHTRRKSGRQQFGPPDSYGMHGHHGYGEHHDQFERDWCAKHPDQAAKEGYNVYGNLNVPRPETALSSEELNRLVNQTNDVGMGTNGTMIGTPTHEIAFTATQEYTSRMNSPKPSPGLAPVRSKRQSSGSQPAIESPLRKAFPSNVRDSGDHAVDLDVDTIHIDSAEFRANKVTGGGPQDGAIDLGPRAGNTEEEGGWFDERGDGLPILASDEVIKRPGSAYMQPAVPPEPHHDDDYYDSDHGRPDSRRSSVRVPSRPSSRPNSMHGEYHGGNLHRFMSHEEHHGSGMGTPLEEIEEYEPLFPEDEKTQDKPKPKALARPGLEHHHFPSQDIWEDAPSSVYYSTTVQTPEPPPEQKAVAPPPPSGASVFETSEQEQKRKESNTKDMTSDDKTFAKPHFKSAVQEDLHRPGAQRFPSQDIWEDTPDSMRLVTTVSAPQAEDSRSPPDERPTTSAIPTSQDDADARATTGFGSMRRPSVPLRPHRRSKLAEEITTELQEGKGESVPDLGVSKQVSPDKAKAPAIPDRPKPSVPARPARISRSAQNEGAPLAKSVPGDEQAVTDAAPAPKVKPAIPARPGGEKIAALKSGFMADLNNRLKLGPQAAAPKVQEPAAEVSEEAQAAPLADSRKGRTKGPARRKPAASPSATAPAAADQSLSFSFSAPMTLWSIDEGDQLQVPSHESEAGEARTSSVDDAKVDLPALEQVLSENEAANTTEPTFVQPASPEQHKASLSSHAPGVIGHEGDEPEPTISPETVQDQKAIASDLETALAEAEAAPVAADAVPAKDANVVSSQIDAEVGRDAATVREKAPEEPSIADPQV